MRSLTVISLLAASISAQGPPPAISIKEGAPVPPDAPKIQTIMVGGPSSKLQFMPEAVSAKPGDTIRFMFMDSDNSVVQTTFEAPCAPKAGGFSAGPLPNPNGQVPGPTMDLKIDNPEPLWMTSKAANACGLGMLFSVNAPPAGNTHSQFKQVAIRDQGKGLKVNAIVADQPAPQVASTITINPGAVNAAAATPGVAGASGPGSVVQGQGTTGNGQPCGCSCFCGSQQPPSNAALGGFGGFFGEMPMGAMSPAGAAPAPAAPPPGEAPAPAAAPPPPPAA